MAATIIREERFDPAGYRDELGAAPGNLDVGTVYAEHSPEEPAIHDLQNAGDAPIRFVTVELLG
jgi:hypothetical protein